MSSPRADRWRRSSRWLAVGAGLALAPKCLLCVAAYVSAGAALGLGGREFCGGSADAWATRPTWLALGSLMAALGILAGRRIFRAGRE